jgi:DNA-binding transcriptional MerR regulator
MRGEETDLKERSNYGMAEKVMTLHELCDVLGISRRTVQGYEKHGLVKASERNKRGYLLYDAQMQTVIAEIRQLQLFGFPVKEIAALRSMPGKELRKRLLVQKTVLEYKRTGLEDQLRRLDELIAQLESE